LEKQLNEKQKLFVREYLKDFNGTRAYKEVYKCDDRTAGTNAWRLLKNAEIQRAIQEQADKRLENAEITIEDVLNELKAIAFVDRTKISKMTTKEKKIDDILITYQSVDFPNTDTLDDETKKVIAGYKQTQSGLAVETYDKMKALELLGKYLGIFKDNSPIINNNINPYANLSEEELRKLAGDQ